LSDVTALVLSNDWVSATLKKTASPTQNFCAIQGAALFDGDEDYGETARPTYQVTLLREDLAFTTGPS